VCEELTQKWKIPNYNTQNWNLQVIDLVDAGVFDGMEQGGEHDAIMDGTRLFLVRVELNVGDADFSEAKL